MLERPDSAASAIGHDLIAGFTMGRIGTRTVGWFAVLGLVASTVVVVSGVLLGLLVGAGASGWWRDVALAWQGVAYGVSDPLLGRDLGVYVAQLPIWRATHSFLVLVVLLALTGVAALYMLVGAIRWIAHWGDCCAGNRRTLDVD